MRTALLFLACSLASSGMAAQLPIRPLPGGGPAAETLLAYTTEHAAYSLVNSFELLKLQVGRIDTRLQTVPFANLSSNALSKARYLIVLSPDSRIDLPTNVVDLVLQSNVPVFWIGQGLDALAGALKSQVYIGEQLHSATAVLSNGQERNVAPFLFREIGVVDNSATVRLNASGSLGSHAHPVCLTAGRFTLFTTEPQNGALGYFLEDVLHDFFQVRETRTNNAFVCIGGYQLHGNHREVRRMSDFLASRSIPFALAARDISPRLTSEAETVEFLSTLRYAQQRGGRVVLAGIGDALQSVLWDADLDRPRSDLTASELRAK